MATGPMNVNMFIYLCHFRDELGVARVECLQRLVVSFVISGEKFLCLMPNNVERD